MNIVFSIPISSSPFPPTTVSTKICSVCKEEKPLSDFILNKKAKSGRGNKCYICYNILERKRYEIKSQPLRQERIRKKNIKQELVKQELLRIKQERLKKLSVPPSTKLCSVCKIEKPISEFMFTKNKDLKKIGYRKKCIFCHRQIKREISKKHYRQNLNKEHDRNKKYDLEHKEERKQYRKLYYSKNSTKLKKSNNQCQVVRRKKDPTFRLRCNLSIRIVDALKGKCKSKRTIELVGCTINELKTHLENKFTEGMTWQNYGKGGWDVDHIIPCAIFELSDPIEQQQCFHYTNLQPLWHLDNMTKSDTITHLCRYDMPSTQSKAP
jgi:hypothetical protein